MFRVLASIRDFVFCFNHSAQNSCGACSKKHSNASVTSCQGAFSFVKMLTTAFTPGSLSNVPEGIVICVYLSVGILEPHVLQKTRLFPRLDSYELKSSSPYSQLSSLDTTLVADINTVP